MNAKAPVVCRVPSPGTTGSSFREELSDILLSRLRLAVVTGLVITLITWVFFHRILAMEPPVMGSVATVGSISHLLFAASFALATLALYAVRGWSTRGLRALDYGLISFTIVLGTFMASSMAPADAPVFTIALLLFIHAAFIPVPVSYQVGLAATAAVAYPALAAAAPAIFPEVEAFWAENGGDEALRATLVQGTFMVGILAAVSVMITKTLYNIRKTLHQAQQLGNYVIQGELGKGGMGDVYVATHALMCRPTAVKVLRADGGEGSALARFEREVQLSATLTHPNTITIYDFGHTKDGTFYYAMELLQGMDLQQLVERFGPVPAERVVHILAQACGPLVEAHERGIVHRDIKPSNLFLTRRGDIYDFVKVLDFGLAKRIDARAPASVTRSGLLVGTPRYFPPESVRGPEALDARSDIYNFGGVAYWMLTGQPPFASTSPIEAIVDHVKTTPRPPSAVSELAIPPMLEELVMRCLEKRPEDRYGCVSDLRRALLAVPLEDPWTDSRAREWWELHVPAEELEVQCIAPEDRMPLPVEMSGVGAPAGRA